jgi:hypothetical protein
LRISKHFYPLDKKASPQEKTKGWFFPALYPELDFLTAASSNSCFRFHRAASIYTHKNTLSTATKKLFHPEQFFWLIISYSSTSAFP